MVRRVGGLLLVARAVLVACARSRARRASTRRGGAIPVALLRRLEAERRV